METIGRRSLLTMFGLAPLLGGLAAWGQWKKPKNGNGGKKLSARERIQQHHLPNIELTTHEGKRVRFYDDLVRDKKVVINFMYAECEGICSPVTANLVSVRKMMGDPLERGIFFYSITLKPEEDSPAALRHYAEIHRTGRGWLFLTGKPGDIETLRRGLGFAYSQPDEDADKSNHIGMLRIGDEAHMRWGSCPGLARPDHILRAIVWDLDRPQTGKAG